jgi:5'-AMP-activated protein kinase, catalytic alpha subunit
MHSIPSAHKSDIPSELHTEATPCTHFLLKAQLCAITEQCLCCAVQREIKISSQLNHPHIIKIYETMETADDIYVVLEYAQSGELFDYITERGKLPEHEARTFFQQLISGIECCHKKMVAHRDIKPENILLDKSHRIKIADFGLSNAMREGHFLKTSCGSPQYAAPEIVSGA